MAKHDINNNNKMAERTESVSATQERESTRQASTGKPSAGKRRAKSKPKESDPGSCFCRSKKGGSLIHCDECDRWCHPQCVGISSEILKALEESTTYYCPLCILKKFTQSPQPTTNESDDDITAITRLEKEFGMVRKEIDEMKKAIHELTSKCDQMKEADTSVANNSIRSQQRILEMHERELRRNNLVIVGAEEDTPKEITAEVVKKVLSNKLNTEIPIVEARRIGKANARRPRPILVRLPDYNAKVSVLKKRSQMKGTNIFINDDLTPLQKKNLAVLLDRMRKARNDGKSAFITRGCLIVDGNREASIDSLESF